MTARGHEARAGRELVGDPGPPTTGDPGPARPGPGGLGSGWVTWATIWLGDPGAPRWIRGQAAGSARREAVRIRLGDPGANWLGDPGRDLIG